MSCCNRLRGPNVRKNSIFFWTWCLNSLSEDRWLNLFCFDQLSAVFYKSSVAVVARSRPFPCRRVTITVSWMRFHNFATALLTAPTISTTLCYFCPGSSQPIIRYAMNSRKTRCWDIFNYPYLKKKKKLGYFFLQLRL